MSQSGIAFAVVAVRGIAHAIYKECEAKRETRNDKKCRKDTLAPARLVTGTLVTYVEEPGTGSNTHPWTATTTVLALS